MPGSPVADIRNSFGAAFVGLLVSTTLFGLIIVQTWLYFWHYRNRDPKALKFFVAFITVMEALDTILCAYAIYWYLVLNFGNVESLDYIMWAMNIQVAIGPAAVVGVCVQIYYARRVYLVSQSIICPILIVALVAISFSFELFFAIEESALKRFSKFHSLLWGPCVGITAAVSAELLIAAAMCWSLYRKRTGDARTDSIITTLMAYSVNSGLLTSLLGTAALISFAVSPSSMIFVACLWVMGKCGVNSLLAMLNSRDYVRERSDADDLDNSFNLSTIRFESRQPGVFVTVHRPTVSDLARRKSDHDVGPTFGFPQPDIAIVPSQGQSRTSGSCG